MIEPDVTEALELRQYLRALRRRWKLVIVTFLVVAGGLLAYSSRLAPVYVSSAALLLQGTDAEQLFDQTPAGSSQELSMQIDTQVEVLRSQLFKDAVAEQLGRVPDVRIERRTDSAVVAIIASARYPRAAAAAAQAYADTYVTGRKDELVKTLGNAITQLETRLATIETRFAELDQPLIELDNQIQAEVSEDAKAVLQDQRDALFELQRGERLVVQGRYQSYVGQLDPLRLSADVIETGGARIVSDASLPRRPFSPRLERNAVTSILVGLIVAISLAYLIDRLDDRIKDPEGFLAIAPGLPLLGSIPVTASRLGRRRRRVGLADQHSAAGEAYGSLATSLRFVGIEREMRTVLFTSASLGEGKTTTVANAAAALARSGQRVVAVDADLRRPRLAAALGLEGHVGLSSTVAGSAGLAEAIQAVPSEPRLTVLPSGPPPPNPSELLSAHAGRILELLAQDADIVLVDSPPLIAVSDGIVLAEAVDAVVLVVKASSTRRRHAARALELLEQVDAPVVGWVLNRSHDESATYGSRYRYADDGAGSHGTRGPSWWRVLGRRRRRLEAAQSHASAAPGSAEGAPLERSLG